MWACPAKQRRNIEIVELMVRLVVVLGVALASKTLVLELGSGWSMVMSQGRSNELTCVANGVSSSYHRRGAKCGSQAWRRLNCSAERLTESVWRAKSVMWNIAWRLEVVGVCVEEGVGSLKVWRLPAATWLSTLGSAPKRAQRLLSWGV